MEQISGSDFNNCTRRVYKITRGSEEFIFKSVTCLLKHKEVKNYLREDFNIQKKSSGPRVIEMIDCRKR